MNSPISIKKLNTQLKNFHQVKLQAQMVSLLNSTKYLKGKKQSFNSTHSLPEKEKWREHFPTHFPKPVLP